MVSDQYKLTVCGCGPAGISPLIYLEEENLLDQLLIEGVCLIDSSKKIGNGNIGEYKITANSLGKVFVEIFEESKSEMFSYIKQKESYKQILENANVAPKLSHVGNLMSDIGVYIEKKIEKNSNSHVHLQHRVEEIHCRRDGKYEIVYKPTAQEKVKRHISEYVLLNIGGRQNVPVFLEKYLKTRSKLTWFSGDFIKGVYDPLLTTLLTDTNKQLNITLLGSSHSAFSTLYRLENHFEVSKKSRVNISVMQRSEVKLYFESVDEARRAGYKFNLDDDVCPQSGRVNRFSGLRYDSFNLAQKLLDGHFQNVHLKRTGDMRQEILEEHLDKQDIIIVCTGYQNNTINFFDENGELIEFKRNDHGLIINKNCNPIKLDNNPMQNIYMYGLGSGLDTNQEYGGEKSFYGRIDGIWLYQHVVSSQIVSQIIK